MDEISAFDSHIYENSTRIVIQQFILAWLLTLSNMYSAFQVIDRVPVKATLHYCHKDI